MNRFGKGMIYDQFEQLARSFRSHKSKPLPIDLSHPSLMSLSLKEAPNMIRAREGNWTLYHRGDLVDLFLSGELSLLQTKKKSSKKRLAIGKRYRSLLYILLEVLER